MNPKNVKEQEKRHRGRPPMTEAQREAARIQREKAGERRQDAITNTEVNDQFLDPRMWASLDPKMLSDIETAIATAKSKFRKVEINALRKRLAALEAEAK